MAVLIGYFYWGRANDRLARELAEANTHLTETTRLLEERRQREQSQKQLETALRQAESRLNELTKELEFERQQRAKLELLLSEGRK